MPSFPAFRGSLPVKCFTASLLVVALLASACGGGDDDEPGTVLASGGPSATVEAKEQPAQTSAAASATTSSPTAVPRDDEKAKGLLLTLADFPPGWTADQGDDKKSPFDECELGKSPGNVGEAESPTFQRDSGSIYEKVVIFESAAAAEGSFARMTKIGECLVSVVNSGKADTNEAKWTEASFSQLSFTPLASKTSAWRMKISIQAKNNLGAATGPKFDLFLDVVLVAQGRYAFSLQATDILSPFSINEFQRFAEKALAKLPK